MRNPYPNFVWFVGAIEETLDDPSQLGRVRVRIVGFHPTAEILPTADLPLAPVLNGGTAKMVKGQMVLGFFLDGEEAQQPCILGTLGGAVSSSPVFDYMRRLGGSINSIFDTSSDPIAPEDLPSLQLGGEKNKQAKAEAEKFLGRTLTDTEWELLIRGTVAEASPNSEEQANVAAVILNRVRSKKYPNDVYGVLYDRGQFQAVTGTSKNGYQSSRNFTNPTDKQIASVTNAILTRIADANKDWLNFTAANPKAYGPGTNIGYLSKAMNTPGKKVIGGTVFFTEI